MLCVAPVTLSLPPPSYRPVSDHTLPPPTAISSYVVTNLSLLSPDVARTLQQLDVELEAGEWTKRGYLKERASLLQHLPSHLVRPNGSVRFEGQQVQIPRGGGGGAAGGGAGLDKRKGHMELNRGEEDVGGAPVSRKLLQVDKEKRKLFHLPEVSGCGRRCGLV